MIAELLNDISSLKAMASLMLNKATMLEQRLLAGGQPVTSPKGKKPVKAEVVAKTTERYLSKRSRRHLKIKKPL